MNSFGGFNFMFGIFPIIFFVVFALVIGVFIYVLTKNASQERKNNNSPKLTSEATVVTKRTHVWGDHSHTDYYVTFQFPSGDRMELEVDTGFGDVRDLAEGGDHRLLFVVNGVEAGADADEKDQSHQSDDDSATELFEVGVFAFSGTSGEFIIVCHDIYSLLL